MIDEELRRRFANLPERSLEGKNIMQTFFDWYISRHPVDSDDKSKLENQDYIGKTDCFYLVHGSTEKEVNPFQRHRKLSSAIKKMEYLEDDRVLRVHTLDSIYDCPLADCKRHRQEPFEILPDPVKEIAEAKLHPVVFGPTEENTILLAFDESDNELNFVDAAYNRKGYISRLEACSNIGSYSDSFLISDDFDSPMAIDIRYYPAVNSKGQFIEFYSFDTSGLAAYLYNVGNKPLSFWTFEGLIDVNPEEKKLVSKENVASDSKGRLAAYKESIRKDLKLN